jgi:ADP-heptose:LPS heptosyltransferase
MDNINSNYIKTASCSVNLLYSRSEMPQGEHILTDYQPNLKLINALQATDELYIYLYLKPLGDSLLFLSAVQAAVDYLCLTRSKKPLTLYAQSDMESLLRHCSLFTNATYIDNIEQTFASAAKNKTVAMVTDGDPFDYSPPSFVFNTEDYLYPKFIETKDGIIVKEYGSRPARYYLTFEREVGLVLSTDPNGSMPTFELPYSKCIELSLTKKSGLDLQKFEVYISLITFVHSKERQKQFGVVRYLEVANQIQRNLKDLKTCFVLFVHKDEEKEIWNELVSYLYKHPQLNVLIYDDKNLEEIAYVLARMSLHIGNDTGISHLASVSRKRRQTSLTPTIIMYSRHDFCKWNSGHPNVIPIYTKLAEHLTTNNRSINRDKLDLVPWGREELASFIPIETVVSKALDVLNTERSLSRFKH